MIPICHFFFLIILFISFSLFLLQEGYKGSAENARGFDTHADETANTGEVKAYKNRNEKAMHMLEYIITFVEKFALRSVVFHGYFQVLDTSLMR